jgi:hypothetical protein
MTLPNFLVIGAAKAGTTSLRDYLGQHPQIFLPGWGEPSFFAHEGERVDFKGPGDDEWTFVTERAAYLRLFEGAAGHRAVGEISPRYLYFPKAPERIHHQLPAARLVAILRHPVDRAYSHFLMNRGRECEPIADFARAVREEGRRLAAGWGWDWCYVGAGRYHEQLRRYYERFPAEQIRVFLYEDYRGDPDRFFDELFAFLGVDPAFRPDTRVKRREAGSPRSLLMRRALAGRTAWKAAAAALVPRAVKRRAKAGLTALNTTRPEPLSPTLRRRLFDEHFADDAAALAELIGRDLGHWARPAPVAEPAA